MKYGIKIVINNQRDERTRNLWHWEAAAATQEPLLFDSKEAAEEYLRDERTCRRIPIYSMDWEDQTMIVQEYNR